VRQVAEPRTHKRARMRDVNLPVSVAASSTSRGAWRRWHARARPWQYRAAAGLVARARRDLGRRYVTRVYRGGW
jgi:hypothetical protein